MVAVASHGCCCGGAAGDADLGSFADPKAGSMVGGMFEIMGDVCLLC